MRMWKLHDPLFSFCIALSCVTGAAGLIHVSGYEGREANVSCPYGEGYESYEKYLCKNDCGNDDVLITTTVTKKNRYSIHDDRKKRIFTTTISHLSHTDVGRYWCGVTRNGRDIYTEVKLEVGSDTCCDRSATVQSYEDSSVSLSCSYDSKHQNSLKYICRGNQTSICRQKAVITSDSQQNGRFGLTDDKESRKFTVTIASLNKKDSGLYLCGVQHTGLDVFSAVELDVKEWCCVKINKVSGTVGHSVIIRCPYPPQHRDNRKFLCKGNNRNNCVDMMTSQSRFTLQEDASPPSFLVTITELNAGDAGTYWCGSDSRWSAGNYTKIQLSVVLQQQTSTVISNTEEPAGSQSTHVTEVAVFYSVVFTVPVVLLTLTFALVIVYKYKCHKVQGAEVNTNRNKTKLAETEEVVGVADDYENQDIVAYSKQGTSKQHSTYDHYDDAGEEQQDSVYQNFTTTEDIYCNQIYIKAKR